MNDGRLHLSGARRPRRTGPGQALLALLALVAPWATPGTAQVILNEVLADPPGSEAHDEFVELLNTSDSVWVDLTGWRLGDADELDRLVDAGQGLRLAPGGLAVVVDASGLDEADGIDTMRKSARIVTIEDRSFGRAGWSNADVEDVILVRTDGVVADQMRYDPAAGRPGHSWERSAGDSTWQISHLPGGTPARANSVDQVTAPDLVVEASPDPFRDRLEIRCRLPAAPALLAVTVFDAAGRQVIRLRDWRDAGVETMVVWDGRDRTGRPCAPGLYVVLVQASEDGRVWHGKTVVARR